MKRLYEVSPRLVARIAGILYLLSILMGVAAMVLSSRGMQIQGDKANLIAGVFYTGLTVLLWYLFHPVNKWISAVAAIFSFAGCWFPPSFYRMAHIGSFTFFGAYCLLIGYLIVQSQFFPRAVGVLMGCAGVCWLIISWPYLDHALSPFPMIVGMVGEGTFMVYLLVRGPDERQWRERDRCRGVSSSPNTSPWLKFNPAGWRPSPKS